MSDSRVDEAPSAEPSRRPSVPDHMVWLSVLSPAALALVVVAVIGRDLWFFSDDWNILADYHSGGLLEPFNGHLSLVPAGIYTLLFNVLGPDSYLPFRIVGLASLAVLAFQVARLVVHRLGGVRNGSRGVPLAMVVGFLAVAAVLWNSAGTMNLMFPFLMNFTIPIAALAAIWWHLDRFSVRGDVLASLWLAVALGTSGLGVMTAGAVAVELLVARAPLRRWLVLSPAPLLWALWFLTHRDANELTTDVPAVIEYAARMLLAAMTSIAAGWQVGGVLVAVAFVAYLVLAGVRWRSLDARLLGALAAPVAFAVFTAVTRIGIVPEIPPDEIRYSWAVAAFFVMVPVVVARPEPLLSRRVPGAVWAGVSAAALVVLVVGGIHLVEDLREWNHRVETARPGLSALLFATEAVGADRVDPDRVIPLSYVPVTTGGYLGGVEAVGSPIDGIDPRTLLGGDPYALSTADQVLVEELPITAEPGDACPSGERAGDPATGTIEVPAGSAVLVESGGERAQRLQISRFASPGPAGLDLPDVASVVRIPSDAGGVDGSGLPYRVTLPDGATATPCG